MQIISLYTASTYGSNTFDSSNYNGSNTVANGTTTGSTTGSTAGGTHGGTLTNTGFELLVIVSLASLIMLAAVVIRFWKRPVDTNA